MRSLLYYTATFGLLILLNPAWVSAQQRQQDILPDSVKAEQKKQIAEILKKEAATEKRRIIDEGYSDVQTGKRSINVAGTLIDFYYPMLPKNGFPVSGYNPPNKEAIEKCKMQKASLVTINKNSTTSKSTRLNAFLTTIGQPIVNYGDTNANRVFGDSFMLKSCKICYAEMEVEVQPNVLTPQGTDLVDDALYIGGTASTFLPYSVGFPLWQPNNFYLHAGTTIPGGYFVPGGALPAPKTLTFQLPTTVMENLAWSGKSVDMYVHDDTRVRRATLRVWYY